MSLLQLYQCFVLRKYSITLLPLVLVLCSLSRPSYTTAQEHDNLQNNSFATPPNSDVEAAREIHSKDYVNRPNHNSTSIMYNIPHMKINRNKLVPVGKPCELDSDCANFSVCLLKLYEPPGLTMKACQCDSNEMIHANSSCFVKPGRQCYFPEKNTHGYSFIQCYPGSTCQAAVNKTAPSNGYCMCSHPSAHYREVNQELEMQRCEAPATLDLFMVTLGCPVFGGCFVALHLILKALFF